MSCTLDISDDYKVTLAVDPIYHFLFIVLIYLTSASEVCSTSQRCCNYLESSSKILPAFLPFG